MVGSDLVGHGSRIAQQMERTGRGLSSRSLLVEVVQDDYVLSLTSQVPEAVGTN